MPKKVLAVLTVSAILAVSALVIWKAASCALSATSATAPGAQDKDSAAVLFEKAKQFAKDGELLKAKGACLKIFERFSNFPNIQKVQEALEEINVRILLSPIMTQDAQQYEVQKGDTLNKVAKKFNTTQDLIVRANGLKDNLLRIGKRLKVTNVKFSIVVDKSQNILTLKSGNEIFKTYRVSTGKNSCTPVGTFTITNKVIDPPWYPPAGGMIPSGDPKNVLGSRWLGLSKAGYGIHGTTQPEAIGKSVTDGCVRMNNSDVEELYAIVPEGTEVVIVD